jgi:predicted acetyltransferase
VPIDIRPIVEDELADFLRVDHAVFGDPVRDDSLERARPRFEIDRSLACFDGDRPVGAAGAFSFRLMLPGLVEAPVAAVSYVGVLPTHRRRGLLRSMMQLQLEDVHRRGEALAVLTSSESGIYARFGYGPATVSCEYALDRARARLRPIPDGGQVRLVEREEARTVLPGIYERYWRGQHGEVLRTPGWWEDPIGLYPDEPGAAFMVVHRGADGDDAYAIYRLDIPWQGGMNDGRVRVGHLVGATPQAEAAMVAYLLGVDLVHTLTFQRRPVEEALRWRLTEPRQLRTNHVMDWLWVRPVDAVAALAARRYRGRGRLVLELHDESCPWNPSRILLEAGPDGAECRAAPELTPQVALGPSELGATYLGGVPLTLLARAGVVDELEPGALATADALLGTDLRPFCSTEF